MITGRLYEAALCNEKEMREKVQSKSKAGAKAIPIKVYWENGKPGKMQPWLCLVYWRRARILNQMLHPASKKLL